MFVPTGDDGAEVAAMQKRHAVWCHRLFAYLEYRQLPQEYKEDEQKYCLYGEFV